MFILCLSEFVLLLISTPDHQIDQQCFKGGVGLDRWLVELQGQPAMHLGCLGFF